MSLRAMLWALHDAPVTDPTTLVVLIALADHAADDGTGAFPSLDTIARYARCSRDTARRHVKQLAEAGVIVPGNPQLTAYIRQDRRPVVWDMAYSMGFTTGVQGATPSQPRGSTGPATGWQKGPHGVAPVPPEPNNQKQTRARAPQSGSRWCAGCDRSHRPTQPCQSSRMTPPPPNLRAMAHTAQEA